MDKFIDALRHSNTTKVQLTSMGEIEFSSEEIIDYIDEIERLARIGIAATDAFDLFSMGTVDEEGKEYFLFLFVEDMMDWWKETYEG